MQSQPFYYDIEARRTESDGKLEIIESDQIYGSLPEEIVVDDISEAYNNMPGQLVDFAYRIRVNSPLSDDIGQRAERAIVGLDLSVEELLNVCYVVPHFKDGGL